MGFGLILFLSQQALLPAEPPREGENVLAWQIVAGKVTGFHYYKPQRNDPGGLTLFYSYAVNNKSYKFETFWYIRNDSEAKAIIHDHSEGSVIDVHYDPQVPQRSYVIKLNPKEII